MQQRNLPQTMHKALKLDLLGNNILQFVLEYADAPNILSSLAAKVGAALAADSCIVVAVPETARQKNEIGYWQENSGAVQTKILRKLAKLPLSSLKCDRIDRTSAVVDVNLDFYPAIKDCLQAIAPHTWIGVVTKNRHRLNGLILLFKSSLDRGVDSESEQLAQTADSIAIAIAQIQLQQRAQTQAEYQAVLRNISREIGQSSHPQSLLETSLAHLCQALEMDRGTVVLLKYKNPLRAKHRQQQLVKGTARVASCWRAKAAKSNSLSETNETSFDLKDSELCQKAWHSAPSHLSFSAHTAFPDLSNESANLLQADGSALLMMPLMGKKSSDKDPAAVLGFLVLQSNREHFWSPDELDLIDWVRVQLSTALVNHQTLTQVQSIVEERTSKLQWSLDVQAKLSSKMRQQIEQLQKLNLLKDDFMSSMSHELKTPLTSMKMAIMMLRQAGISPEMREKYLDILEQEWHREYDLIKDLLTLQSMESGEFDYTPEELNLTQTISDLAQSFTNKWQPEKGIELHTHILDSNLKINTDVESLKNILNELLLNAAKYSDDNTVVKLSARSQTTVKGKSIVISVINQGAEITTEELPHIFDKFRRGKGVTDRAVPGTGLGLALVQYLVEHLNGTIEVTNEPETGTPDTYLTTFVLELPQSQLSIA